MPGQLRAEAILGLEGGAILEEQRGGLIRILGGDRKISGQEQKELCASQEGFIGGNRMGGAGGHGIKRRGEATFYSTPSVHQPFTHSTSFKPHHSPAKQRLLGPFSRCVEAPRSKVVSLESHGHKVDVQGSGPGTQAVHGA